MSHALKLACRRMMVPALAALAACVATPAHAHVHWSRTNSVVADTVALYHFDNATTTVAPPAAPMAAGLGLTSISTSVNLSPIADTPGPVFDTQALVMPVAQTLRSTDTVSQLAGDLTIECWFKWTPEMTTSSLEIGLQSGARIVVARDESAPANDLFGVAGTHGSYVGSPDFINWPAVGDEEASLSEWRHLALTIHSTGIYYDAAQDHDRYSTGTVGRLYLNGHVVGFLPNTIDLAGLKVHDASRVTIIMRGGGIAVDEVTVWRRDWSNNGLNTNPFSDGRGVESRIDEWLEYCDPFQ